MAETKNEQQPHNFIEVGEYNLYRQIHRVTISVFRS